MVRKINSILIANRGEIACRIIRTVKSLGLRAIAIYSEADEGELHVRMADDAYCVGAAPVNDSYLCSDKIIKVAQNADADAIHPGYGFLAENADFARLCADNDLIFIGPSPDAVEIMGDKAKAKRRMLAANVPCIPGYQGENQSDEALLKAASEVGFPLMVKAAAGGGGRGMRLVENQDDLANAISTARSEAENAFGAGDLILERAVLEPRHVEIQILGDSHGNVIHLGERDCSVQRRHQKVLEEAPCPVMDADLRSAMGAAAVKAASEINYVGAGTVEFLLDKDGSFYFLEMNTRLQVEHPVTEMVTGVDLVAEQIAIGSGAALSIAQEDVALSGHAIEARLYAEDASNDFLPATGIVDLWRPAEKDGLRYDSGIDTGAVVSPFYDPMLAKVIAHGPTREVARRRLVRALSETALFGVTNNKAFLIDALNNDEFSNGLATTGFIAKHFAKASLASRPLTFDIATMAAALLYYVGRANAYANTLSMTPALLNWISANPISVPFSICSNEETVDLDITPKDSNTYFARNIEQRSSVCIEKFDDHKAVLAIDGKRHELLFNAKSDGQEFFSIQLSIDGADYSLTNANALRANRTEAGGAGSVLAPMHGSLIEMCVAAGQEVSRGDRLAILEAMKMQHELLAEIDGVITTIHVGAGEQVAAKTLLFEIAETQK